MRGKMTTVKKCVLCMAAVVIAATTTAGGSPMTRAAEGAMDDGSRKDGMDRSTRENATLGSVSLADRAGSELTDGSQRGLGTAGTAGSRTAGLDLRTWVGRGHGSSSSTRRRRRKRQGRRHQDVEAARGKRSARYRGLIGPNPSAGGPDRANASESLFAVDFLRSFGYFRQVTPLNLVMGPSSDTDQIIRRTEDSRSEAIRMFQSYFGLAQTGLLDAETVGLMKKDRCGVADIPQEIREDTSKPIMDDQSPAQFSLMGDKWANNDLTWHLERPTRQLETNQQRRAVREALEEWRYHVPLNFREVERPRPEDKIDIHVQYGSRDHGDGYHFDGEGLVLAHAFGPGGHSLAGDMHMDDDEKWAEDVSDFRKSALFLVSLHELGHSLGLSHSRNPDAIMFPYYGLTDTLGQDDIKGIQSLYGVRTDQPRTMAPPTRPDTTERPPITRQPSTRTPATTHVPFTRFPFTKSHAYTNRPPTTPTSDCLIEFDHVIQDEGSGSEVYTGMIGDQYYRFTKDRVLNEQPAPLHSRYPGAPVDADAVFTVPEPQSSNTYFVKGNKVWKYQNYVMASSFPKTLNSQHFLENIQFILPLMDTNGNRRIFVFGKTLWVEYNFDQPPSQRPPHYSIPQYWPYISIDVSYAVARNDRTVYLISPNSHVFVDSFRRGKKYNGHPEWMRPACLLSSPHSSGSYSVQTTFAPFALTSLLLSFLMY